MSSYLDCNILVKGDTKTSISNITDALSHYRGRSGKTVYANQNLINEMKNHNSYQKMINELKETIKKKITQNKINNRETIKAESGSSRALRCTCLGSYSVNIDYSFIPNNGNNNITIHFSGNDSWDFDWNDKAGFWYNVSQEFIPSIVAGKGKSFKITYDFVENVTINF